MPAYIALVRKNEGTSHGVSFPDEPRSVEAPALLHLSSCQGLTLASIPLRISDGRRRKMPDSKPSTEDFRTAIRERLAAAQAAGRQELDITSGDLHRELGSYPGPDHRMPNCCAAMRSQMKPGDTITSQPPKGKGASLRIRYGLPR
jgi:5-methylcytosine-specific restriction protein A